jgi:hypothetical protein
MADILFDFEIPDFNEITPEGQRLLLVKTIKSNGSWRIHKSEETQIGF